MGSGGSKQEPPQQTQSAPPTARTTPKPRRNQQFQEVQINQAGGNPKPQQGGNPKPQTTPRGQGPSPNPHQSTSNQPKARQRGQDPGASGSSTDRSSRSQQPQNRGAAANGRQRNNMPGGQDKGHRMSFEEFMAKCSRDLSIVANETKPPDGRTERPEGTQAAAGSSGANNSSNSTTQQMVNDVDKSQKGTPGKGHVTGKADKKKNSVILVKPGKPIQVKNDSKNQDEKDKKGIKDQVDVKSAGDQSKNSETKPGAKQGGILQRSKIFRSGLKGIQEENEEEKSDQSKQTQNDVAGKGKQINQRKGNANAPKQAGSSRKTFDRKSEKPDNKEEPKSQTLNGIDTTADKKEVDKSSLKENQTGTPGKPDNNKTEMLGNKGKANSDKQPIYKSIVEEGKKDQPKANIKGADKPQEKQKNIANPQGKSETKKSAKDTMQKEGPGKPASTFGQVDKNLKTAGSLAGRPNTDGRANISNGSELNEKKEPHLANGKDLNVKMKAIEREEKEEQANEKVGVEADTSIKGIEENKLKNSDKIVASDTVSKSKDQANDNNIIDNRKLEENRKNTESQKNGQEDVNVASTSSRETDMNNVNHSSTAVTNMEEKHANETVTSSKKKKKVMDEKGYLNLEVLEKVTDQIQKLQEEGIAGDTLSQLSYDNFYGDDNKLEHESIGSAADLSHDLDAGGAENEVGASEADGRDPELLSMKEDDIVFETFYHRSGKEFQCIYQSGMRFYLDDWGSKEWQPFPKRWYNEGLLVTNTILRDEGAEQAGRGNDQAGASGQGQSQSRSQGRSQGGGGGGGSGDDREGFIMHPSRGRIPTYIFYKKHNVHMYFDKETGSWVRLPIGWELHHDMVKSLVDQVEEAVPTWGDRHDILALLRACNYDPDECISIYMHLEKDEWMKAPRTSKEAKGLSDKENKVAELEKRNRELEIELQKERQRREELERNLDEQTNKLSEVEAESKQTEAQLSAMTGGRPKSARPISVMMMAGRGKPGKGGKQSRAGEVVNPDDVQDLNANAMELRKAHTKLKAEVERYFGDFRHIVGQVGPAIKKMKQSEKGTQAEIEEVRALYRKEALQRKLLYNQLQEMRGNIRVFCRVRKDDRAENCLKYPSDQDIIALNPQQGKKMFNFDKVFEPTSTQEQVFEDTKPIITSCADGYNVCLLAYGQTGSGKTFTMMGPDSNPGINIRAMKELFQVCAERSETMTYTLTVSLVEIYNETIQDLLTNDAKTLELRTAGNKVQIPGLTEHPIKNVDDVKKVMTMGDKNRSVASTKMNSTSSRSHLVLMLAVEGRDKVTNAVSRGTLVLCDLAGSERISKTEAEGQRLVEAAAINKSLSALGQVFNALRTSQLHVPYRNSKLTQILQPSLGGDAKACLFVNISPDSYNYSETVSTLTFGSNARQVALGQAKQNISKGK